MKKKNHCQTNLFIYRNLVITYYYCFFQNQECPRPNGTERLNSRRKRRLLRNGGYCRTAMVNKSSRCHVRVDLVECEIRFQGPDCSPTKRVLRVRRLHTIENVFFFYILDVRNFGHS